MYTQRERVIFKIRETKYRKDDQSFDDERWESDLPKWEDRIDLAADIIKRLEERGIFVLLFSNGYYITISRPEKIYEGFKLSILNLDLNSNEPLIPYVKDSASGLSYRTDNNEAVDFVDLFLWTTGELEGPERCQRVITSNKWINLDFIGIFGIITVSIFR